MTSFLLTISFLLHLISIIAIFFLFHQLSQLRNTYMTEVSEIFERYLAEIREENERLMNDLNQNKQEQIPISEPDSAPKEEPKELELPPFANKQLSETEDKVETSLQAQILQLYEQGLTIDQIAKQLNCGKTEAELIINFHQKKVDKA